MGDNIARLVTEKQSDTDVAIELKARAIPLIEQLCAVIDEARAKGLTMGFNISNDQYGRSVYAVNIVKPL